MGAAIVAAIGITGTYATIAAFAVNMALSYLVSSALGSIFGKKQAGFSSEMRDRTQVVRSAVQPRNIVYGTAVTSGPLVFAGSSGEGNKFLHLVIALANHECEAIDEVYLGDDPIGFLDPSGGVTGGKYYKGHSLLRIKKHMGSINQEADADLMDALPANWSANHRLRGVCYVYVRLEFDPEVFASGLPNIKVRLRGKKAIYDPRSGSAGWSDNWALCMYDYMRSSEGLACDEDDIETTSVIVAANVSDELVLVGDNVFQYRYRCNGIVGTDAAPDDNLRNMSTAGGGPVPVLAGGVFRIYAGAYEVPTARLTASDLRGAIKVRPHPSRKDLFNQVKGTYVDGASTWQPVDFPLIKNDLYAAQDGGAIAKDIELPFTTEVIMAQRLAKITLERARQSIVVEFPAKITAFALTAWMPVYLTIPKFGWEDKVFRVMDWKFQTDNGGVDLVLAEESPSSYAWNLGDETIVDDAPPTNLPVSGYVEPLAELAVSSGPDYQMILGDGTAITRMFVTWPRAVAMGAPGGRIDLEYKTADSLLWTQGLSVSGDSTSTYISPVIDDVIYNVRARVVSARGTRSEWAYASPHRTMGAALNPPRNLRLEQPWIGKQVLIAWDVLEGAQSYNVQVMAEGNVVRMVSNITSTRYSYSKEEMIADGGIWRALTFRVAGCSFGGRIGLYSELAAANPQIAPLAGLAVEAGYQSVNFKCATPAESDFEGILVWLERTPDATLDIAKAIYNGPGTLTFTGKLGDGTAIAQGGTYYLFAAGYDDFGLDHLNISASISVTIPHNIASELLEGVVDESKLSPGLHDKISSMEDQLANIPDGAALAQLAAAQRNSQSNQDAQAGQLVLAATAGDKVAHTLARSVNTVQTTVKGNTAAVELLLESVDGIEAQAWLKATANGRVAGMSLGVHGNVAEVAFIADRFFVAANDTDTASALFTIITAPTVISGQQVLPGVYINAAFINSAVIAQAIVGKAIIDQANIKDASIGSAQMQDAAITTAKIADTIQSSNYLAGSRGWKIWTKTGNAEFNGVTIRGDMTAGSISIGGLFQVTAAGVMTMQSATSGARLLITGDVIKVFDANGVRRVQIGNLAV
jgi:hypothetical protein